MSNPSYDQAVEKSKTINELHKAVRQQLSGDMDWVRTRAFWESRLPDLNPEHLAEALTTAICAEARYRRS